MPLDPELLARFHRALVDEIRRSRPEYLDHSFTVAEIYQDLVPYRTHRNVIGVTMNGDYEDALLRLLAGEGNYLVLDSEPARRELRKELESSNPDPSLYREFAAVDVRLNPAVRDSVGPDLGDQATGASLGQDEPASGHGRDEATAALEAADVEGDEAVTEGGVAEDDAGAAGPEAASSDAAVADRGNRIWAIDASPSGSTGGEPGTAHVPDEGPGGSGGACNWCGELLPERPGMSYCPHCGGDVRLVPCPACGEALEPSWRFCVACGTEVTSS
jgi:hypothetical protein